MISANDAKKSADYNKNHVTEVANLLNHFDQLCRKASNQGKTSIDKLVFPEDQFKPETLTEVCAKLKDSGYKVVTSKNNAHQQIGIEVSW